MEAQLDMRALRWNRSGRLRLFSFLPKLSEVLEARCLARFDKLLLDVSLDLPLPSQCFRLTAFHLLKIMNRYTFPRFTLGG